VAVHSAELVGFVSMSFVPIFLMILLNIYRVGGPKAYGTFTGINLSYIPIPTALHIKFATFVLSQLTMKTLTCYNVQAEEASCQTYH
jgi:hypothetical protein